MVIKILFSSPFSEIRNSFMLLVLRIFTLFQRVETVFLIKTIKKPNFYDFFSFFKNIKGKKFSIYCNFLEGNVVQPQLMDKCSFKKRISAYKCRRDKTRMSEFYIPLPHEIIDVGKGHQ